MKGFGEDEMGCFSTNRNGYLTRVLCDRQNLCSVTYWRGMIVKKSKRRKWISTALTSTRSIGTNERGTFEYARNVIEFAG